MSDSKMEEVSLNSVPIFDDEDEYETEQDGIMLEQDDETGGASTTHAPPSPTIGLEFDSFEKAYDYYNTYAKDQGFGIRVSNSWFRSKRKERYRAKLSCSNAGFKKKSEANRPRPETRTGCPAMIVIRLVDLKRWRIIEAELQHNHQVSPEIRRFYKSHKKMIVAAQKAQNKVPRTEVHTIKLYRTGCNGGFNEIDCRNTGDHSFSKHLKLKEGDAVAVYNYFCRMKLTNSNFFYLMDLDSQGRLMNIFWSDHRSRVAYGYFGDTIMIDSTSLSNKYETPLISFFGVNHHGQSVLFGCGFVGNESVESFVWVFKAWLSCMLNCPPQVIITDQSIPLTRAVSLVFPEARHCYSLWYIIPRLQEKLGGLRGYEAIKLQLTKSVYNSLKITEFESSWIDMINKHGLGHNQWLQSLFNDRQKWVPVYLKDTFFAGMIPNQENECFIPFFDGYVHKHTSIKEFVDKYDLAIHRKLFKEAMADQESRNQNFDLKTRCSFESQLAKVYTKAIFTKFQSEVEGMYSCFNTTQLNATGPIITYLVKERVENESNKKEIKTYEVLYETTLADIRCVCSLFSFKGYLCRHALNVLNYSGIEQVPSRYIMKRWCKDFKRIELIGYGPDSFDPKNPINWYTDLYRRAMQVVEEGALSPEHYNVALHELEQLLNKFNIADDNLA